MSAKFTNVPVTFNGVMIGRADVDPDSGTINIMVGGRTGRKLFENLNKGLGDTFSIDHVVEVTNRSEEAANLGAILKNGNSNAVVTDTLYDEKTAEEAEKQAIEAEMEAFGDMENSGS